MVGKPTFIDGRDPDAQAKYVAALRAEGKRVLDIDVETPEQLARRMEVYKNAYDWSKAVACVRELYRASAARQPPRQSDNAFRTWARAERADWDATAIVMPKVFLQLTSAATDATAADLHVRMVQFNVIRQTGSLTRDQLLAKCDELLPEFKGASAGILASLP
jgi:hypothetical protein